MIRAENLSLGYDGHAVVRGLGFSVERGDFLSIVGENGSGKTTLARALLGLEKPILGELWLASSLRASGIGYVPQSADELREFPASVGEVVGSGLVKKQGIRPVSNAEDRRAACDAMGRLGIYRLRRRAFGKLSGGERRRVLIARALCACGDVLLLDEAAAGLDVLATNELYAQLAQLNKAEGVTVVSISHDIASALEHSNKILHLGDGKLLFFGSAGDYAASAAGRLFLNGGAADV